MVAVPVFLVSSQAGVPLVISQAGVPLISSQAGVPLIPSQAGVPLISSQAGVPLISHQLDPAPRITLFLQLLTPFQFSTRHNDNRGDFQQGFLGIGPCNY